MSALKSERRWLKARISVGQTKVTAREEDVGGAGSRKSGTIVKEMHSGEGGSIVRLDGGRQNHAREKGREEQVSFGTPTTKEGRGARTVERVEEEDDPFALVLLELDGLRAVRRGRVSRGVLDSTLPRKTG